MVKRMVWNQYFLLLFLTLYVRVLFSLASINVEEHNFINGDGDEDKKTKWAVLVAGSRYYENYRHQADVCHAYQILKKGGLNDENIIVFMYDDIAFDTYNPRPGVIINKPDGPDVYDGVPKDYTGKHCTASNLYAAILGNKSALTGGSGKVVDSGPNDHIFIYYTDHGAPGLLQMPEGPLVYAKDLMEVLKKKHAAKAYKSMVIYVEACESGSMFEGLLPKNMNIYATTASNGKESSYGTYCPGDIYAPPPEYDVCLGDMYSISWLEDSDKMDARKETLGDQYEAVKRRTEDSILDDTSHVMQYGNMKQRTDFLISYIGSNPANENITSTNNHDHDHHEDHTSTFSSTVVSQRDANLLHYWHKFHKASPGSGEKLEAQKQLNNEISQRKRIDNIMNQIGKLLFGTYENGSKVMNNVKPSGQPLVDDWDCFKMHVETYEKYCGRLSNYGMKYTRAFANMCDVGITKDQLVEALVSTCSN